ncbi:MAG: apolipoprotein N-acyltransferase, partial [Gallionellaceae bacterium]|nr:apolipoprotein N-acyltransferase [Gallionellaceae bacterium]
MNHISAPMLSLLLGLLAVGGFAPFSLFPLPVVVLAILFWQWQHTSGKWAVARLGFAFGLGLFGAGVGWIFVAMHDYGDMSFVAALLATTLFVAFYALFPALVAYLQTKLPAPTWVRWVLYMPALWVLLEWLRGLIFTGLPWLALGYSQAAASPLAGYAPLFGVYGVSLAVAVSAGLLANLYQARWSKSGRLALLALVLLWGAGAVLRTVEWTQVTGGPFQVSLVQGNIPQELKFREEKLVDTLETYRRLVLQSSARLIVLPETALPMLRHELPPTY